MTLRALLLSLAGLCGVAACHQPTAPPPTPDPLAPPVLENLGSQFGALDAAAGQAGDFFVTTAVPRPFDEFGYVVTDTSGNPKPLAHYTYVVSDDAPIVAAFDGVVREVFNQGSDYEILLFPFAESQWWVSYDHVVNLQIAKGAMVHTGQTLAFPAAFTQTFRNGAGRRAGGYEFMLGNYADGLAHCPIEYMDAASRDTFRARIRQLMQDIESFSSDLTIFNEPAMVDAGCLAHTYPL